MKEKLIQDPSFLSIHNSLQSLIGPVCGEIETQVPNLPLLFLHHSMSRRRLKSQGGTVCTYANNVQTNSANTRLAQGDSLSI